MKKISLLLFFCAGLITASCVDPLSVQPGLNGGAYDISLSVVCKTPNTKVLVETGEMTGEDIYNENLLSTVDWFIFSSSDPDGVLYTHDQIVSPDQTIEGSTSLKTNDIIIKDLISMDSYVENADYGYTGYIYVIANLPGDVSLDNVTTLADLLSIELTANFGKVDNTGKFAAQDNFVMSGGVAFDFNNGQHLTKVAQIARLASKISMDLSVVPAIDDIRTLPDGTTQYVRTWYPELDQIEVYISYADNRAILDGTPEEYNTEEGSKFFTYNRSAYKSTITPDFEVIGAQDTRWDNGFTWNLSGTPFYTYPVKWKTESSTAPFIKIILPWTPYDETNGIVVEDGIFKRAGRSRSIRKGATQEFFYKISLPSENIIDEEGDDKGKYQLLMNEWYHLILDVAILGGTADDLPLELAGQYYIVDWSNPDFTAGGSLKQGRYLSTATDTYYIYGGNDIEIPVFSSHDLDNTKTVITGRRWNAKLTTASKWETINRGSVSVDGRSAFTFTNELHTAINSNLDCYYMEFTVTVFNDAGLEKTVTIIQYPPIYLDSQKGGNAFVDGYFGNINNTYRGTNGSGNNSGTNEGNTVQTPYAPITRYVNENSSTNNVSLTIVSISSLGGNTEYTIPRDVSVTGSGSTTDNYIIADPREMGGFNDLEPYWTGPYNNGQTNQWNDSDVASIKVGNTTIPNFIAPKVLVSSRWGRMGNWNPHNYDEDYETAKKRCATYQEKGYPAGRWRLPTEAEILFVINMQKNGFIRDLYTTGWSISASGSAFRVTANNTDIYYVKDVKNLRQLGTNAYGGNGHVPSCRCVYDLWYWGDDPVDGVDGTYTIKVDY